MSEGELQKHQKYVVRDEWLDEEPLNDKILQNMTVPMVFSSTIDDAKKDFELSEDEEFVLEEYGFEELNKLTHDAAELKIEILVKTVKKYRKAKKKWFGDPE